jgi:hypothetical protein
MIPHFSIIVSLDTMPADRGYLASPSTTFAEPLAQHASPSFRAS